MAWEPLGWEPVFFSEIEKFPSAVLAHHYGANMPGEPHATNGVPNYGDMTKFKDWPDDTIDLLVGGTPCQGFSVAGLREGLDDPRSNLALCFLAIAERYNAKWITWENVPGVLSTNGGRDFGAILGALVKLGYGFAWRVLDAQYVRVDGFHRAVPQRRRRVFLVGYLGDWQPPAAVLFERESLQGHPAPCRKPGQSVAPTISCRPTGGGGLGTDFDCDGGLVAAYGGGNCSGPVEVSTALTAHGTRQDFEVETFIASSTENPVFAPDVAHTLRGEGFDASEDGCGRGTPLVPVAFDCKASGRNGFSVSDEISPTLRAMGHANSHSNSGGQVAVAFAQNSRDEVRMVGGDGAVCGALAADAGSKQQTYLAQAFDMRGRDGGAQFEGPHDTANMRASEGGSSRSYVSQPRAVRRLMPIECERLQGFPDNHTRIPWRGKGPEHCPDGPRYKALGNSKAINVVRWIGQRIDAVEKLLNEMGGVQ